MPFVDQLLFFGLICIWRCQYSLQVSPLHFLFVLIVFNLCYSVFFSAIHICVSSASFKLFLLVLQVSSAQIRYTILSFSPVDLSLESVFYFFFVSQLLIIIQYFATCLQAYEVSFLLMGLCVPLWFILLFLYLLSILLFSP